MKRTACFLTLWALLLLAFTLWCPAGSEYECACPQQGCGWRATLGIGGTKMMEMKTGWCLGCRDFVSVTWDRGGKPVVPRKAWDPVSGEDVFLFTCPKCKGLFIPLESIESLDKCPKCHRPGVTKKRTIMYD